MHFLRWAAYFAAFASVHKFGLFVLDEHELFKRLIKAAIGDEWVSGDPPGTVN